jgi:hypothetical protein
MTVRPPHRLRRRRRKNPASLSSRGRERLSPNLPTVSLTSRHRSTFYLQRVNRKRQAEIAKRNRERMQDPTFFPSVPKNLP